MKALFLTLLLSVFAFSATHNVSNLDPATGRPKIVQMEQGYIAEFVMDVSLDSAGSLYSRPYDLGKHPLKSRTDTTGVYDLSLGTVTVSCYDESNGTGDDSINVAVVMQTSDYAADGNDPLGAFSDVWVKEDSVLVNGVSENGALVEGTIAATLNDQEVRFVRYWARNLSTDAQSFDARCRVYWTKKGLN